MYCDLANHTHPKMLLTLDQGDNGPIVWETILDYVGIINVMYKNMIIIKDRKHLLFIWKRKIY